MAKKFFEPKISVIIPMYNAEKYVGECLESLLNQTLQNFEVIVVDDCSKDNSISVVKKFLPKFDGRLNLIKQKKNSGCAAIPRNIGLKSARGKYIYFLDSDDFIDKTALEDFFEVAENFDADVVHSEKFFEYRDENQNGLTSYQQGEFVDKPTLETFDISERIKKFFKKNFLWWGCNKLFRRKFLEENKIRFPSMKYYEDYVFIFCCVVSAKNYVRVPFASYHYRIRQDSMSRSQSLLDDINFACTSVGIMDDFMLSQKFFQENIDKRYIVIDNFMNWVAPKVEKGLFNDLNLNIEQIYLLLYEKFFADNSKKNSAFVTYFFLMNHLYRFNSEQQENKIAELQNQLAKFQS